MTATATYDSNCNLWQQLQLCSNCNLLQQLQLWQQLQLYDSNCNLLQQIQLWQQLQLTAAIATVYSNCIATATT